MAIIEAILSTRPELTKSNHNTIIIASSLSRLHVHVMYQCRHHKKHFNNNQAMETMKNDDNICFVVMIVIIFCHSHFFPI